MKKNPLRKLNFFFHSLKAFFQKEGAALLVLAASLAFCFKDWIHFTSKIFLSLDSTVLYYPLTVWVHDHLAQGQLPLISDLLYNGAPVAATSMAGVLSPFLWLIHGLFSGIILYNVLFIVPFVLYLFGTYFLGRELSLSRTASILLALLWVYNGHQMAQLDHQNVAWAHAFFPWAFLCLLRYHRQNRAFWLLSASLTWGCCLFSGHPQVVFLEGLFFLFWALLYPQWTWVARFKSVGTMTLGTFFFTAPLTLFTTTFMSGDKWSDLDRFFHSWTPVNVITLVFPWFFGRDQYDRLNSDYWWQYQFVEMQIALSIVALFFILLFFVSKNVHRRWIVFTVIFGLAMALGKFFLIYPFVQSLPFFSFFRDPARYWFLITWAVGLGAAYTWDDWFNHETLIPQGRKLSLGLLIGSLSFIAIGWLLLNQGQTLIQSVASWFIQHFLIGDSFHTQSLNVYLDRLPAKLNAISSNLNLMSPRIFGPLLFLTTLVLLVFNKKKWNLSLQKSLLILLVFIDLMAFRMPLGNAFYSPQDIPNPQIPLTEHRSLPLISQTNSPLPAQYGEYAFPNMNLISHSAVLPFDANPSLSRYNALLARLGWFAWVYKDRDLLGFTHHLHLLSILGVDQIVSDTPFTLPSEFKTQQDHSPYVYSVPHASPKAYLADQYEIFPWPQSIDVLESANFNPSQTVLLESDPGFPSSQKSHSLAEPQIQEWSETHLVLTAQTQGPSLLVLQKTFLPGWRAKVNNNPVQPMLGNLVLMAVPLTTGKNQVELSFTPVSLRLGFFLSLLFLGVFILSWGCFILA